MSLSSNNWKTLLLPLNTINWGEKVLMNISVYLKEDKKNSRGKLQENVIEFSISDK